MASSTAWHLQHHGHSSRVRHTFVYYRDDPFKSLVSQEAGVLHQNRFMAPGSSRNVVVFYMPRCDQMFPFVVFRYKTLLKRNVSVRTGAATTVDLILEPQVANTVHKESFDDTDKVHGMA